MENVGSWGLSESVRVRSLKFFRVRSNCFRVPLIDTVKGGLADTNDDDDDEELSKYILDTSRVPAESLFHHTSKKGARIYLLSSALTDIEVCIWCRYRNIHTVQYPLTPVIRYRMYNPTYL